MLCALKGVLKIMAVKGSVTDAVRQGHSSQGKRASWCIHRTCLGLWGQQSPVPGQTQIPVKRGVQKVESDIWGHCGKEERTE